jgi:anti-sigma B factor antagonist
MNNDIVKGFDDGEANDTIKIRLEKYEPIPGCLTFHLCGYIDLYNHHYFQSKALMAIKAGFTRIVLDLREVSFIGSAGVASIVHILRTVRSLGGDLVLQEIQARTNEVFELLGFAQFFHASTSRDESVAFLSRKPSPGAFPKIFACPICAIKLRAARAGRYRCSHCRTILALADTGAVDLG